MDVDVSMVARMMVALIYALLLDSICDQTVEMCRVPCAVELITCALNGLSNVSERMNNDHMPYRANMLLAR